MDEKLWPNRKVCDYTFNFMAMSCLLQLIILWHLSKATRLFLIACVHYNYKRVTNSIIGFQISSSVNDLSVATCVSLLKAYSHILMSTMTAKLIIYEVIDLKFSSSE
jgi:hypothetical protein